MSVYKVLIKLRYIDCVKQRDRDIRVCIEATGTSHFKSIFATDTITLQMTLKRYEVISHSSKSCFSNSPIVSVFVQVTSSETPIWDTTPFLNSLLLISSAITDRSEDITWSLVTYSNLLYIFSPSNTKNAFLWTYYHGGRRSSLDIFPILRYMKTLIFKYQTT